MANLTPLQAALAHRVLNLASLNLKRRKMMEEAQLRLKGKDLTSTLKTLVEDMPEASPGSVVYEMGTLYHTLYPEFRVEFQLRVSAGEPTAMRWVEAFKRTPR
jgi:hypothetical protein